MLRNLMMMITLLVTAIPAAAQDGVVWKAEYFDNPYLIGRLVTTRPESHINFDWGLSSPDRRVPDDNFSARFTADVYFPAGNYRFSVLADDRVRVSVAFQPIIDTFERPQPGTQLSADVPLPEGVHHLQIDYREDVSEAYLSFSWARIDPGSDAPQLPVLLTSAPLVNPNPWEAAYYANPTLSEPFQFKRTEPQGPARGFSTNPPREDLPADNFSVRWESIQPLAAGTYQIRVRADDGVRVYIDGNRVIDQWHTATGQIYTHTFTVEQGNYRFTVEHYDATGNAFVDYNLVLLSGQSYDGLYTLPGSGASAPAAAAPAAQIPANAQPTGYLVTAADNVNLRGGPGRNFAVVGKLPFEAQAAVLGRDASLIWWLVDYNGTVGWVSARFGRIQPDANINQIPVVG